MSQAIVFHGNLERLTLGGDFDAASDRYRQKSRVDVN